MKLECVPVADHPREIAAASGAGPIYVLCLAGRLRDRLYAITSEGRIAWSRTFASGGSDLRVSRSGHVWVCEHRVLVETRPDGQPGRTVACPARRGEKLSSFLVLDDGFILAWTSFDTGRVERIDCNGGRIWTTPIAPHISAFQDSFVEHRPSDGSRSVPACEPDASALRRRQFWMPESLLVSAGRLLAIYHDPVADGVGVGYGIDLETGKRIWATGAYPLGDDAAAIAGPGLFLVGGEGFGFTQTALYDRDGRIAARWPTSGQSLVSSRGPIRIVEMDDTHPSGMRLRLLHRDGSMTDGPLLPGYSTGGPVAAADGCVAFWRGDRLHIADSNLTMTTTAHHDHAKAHDRMMLLNDGLLAFIRHGPAGIADLVFARTDLPSLDTGPWPCRGGNLRNNPVLP